MGYGDEIMAAGRAARMQQSDPRPVAVLDFRGEPRWHDAWIGNPRIASPQDVRRGLDVQTLVDGPRRRPYVDTRDRRRWKMRPGHSVRGELYLSARDRAVVPAGDYIAVVTMSKEGGNRDWGAARFWDVARRIDAPWVHVTPYAEPTPGGIARAECKSFRQAAAVISGARAFLSNEGGMIHAAGAFHVPGVAVYGGFQHPCITGEVYTEQVPVVYDHPLTPCGNRDHCDHCEMAKRNITPEDVAQAMQSLLERTHASGSAAA